MYKLTDTSGVIRKADNTYIPDDPRNADYQDYQEWLAAGNTAEPADAPTVAEQNAPILAAIQALEASQARAMREHVLGDSLALDRLRAIDDKIQLERAKLVK